MLLYIIGSSVEVGGKVVWPHDIGDLDIMISHKKQTFSHSELEDIPGHPGFVKIKTKDDSGDGYVKTTDLKSSIPEGFNDILKLIKMHGSLSGTSLKVIPKCLGPATEISLETNIPSLTEQWRSLPEISDDQLAILENMMRITVDARDPEQKEKMIQEISMAFKKTAEETSRQKIGGFYEIIEHMASLTVEKIDQLRQEESGEDEFINTINQSDEILDAGVKTQEQSISKFPEREDNKKSSTMKANPEVDVEPVKQPGESDVEPLNIPGKSDVKPVKLPGETDVKPVKLTLEADVEPVKPPGETDVEPVKLTLEADVEPVKLTLEADVKPVKLAGKLMQKNSNVTYPILKDGISEETQKAVDDLMEKLTYNAIFKPKEAEKPEIASTNLNVYSKQTLITEMDENAGRKIGIDLVMSIKVLNGWEAIGEEFMSREGRYWPSEEAMEDIKKCFIYIVVKHPPDMPEKEQYFCFR